MMKYFSNQIAQAVATANQRADEPLSIKALVARLKLEQSVRSHISSSSHFNEDFGASLQRSLGYLKALLAQPQVKDHHREGLEAIYQRTQQQWIGHIQSTHTGPSAQHAATPASFWAKNQAVSSPQPAASASNQSPGLKRG
ncbi:MAG: hypothetical protein DHS20C10_07470 [marine bacterium B5-7]|nr:MAG: hypothetical protein DHS20C10_07470 [marine bacterium B5-7]